MRFLHAFVLLAAPLWAESKPFDSLPAQLRAEATYASTFTEGEEAEVAEADLGIQQERVKGGNYCFGKKVKHWSWVHGFNKRAFLEQAFTISFDVIDIQGKEHETALSIYTPGHKGDNGLRLIIGKNNKLELSCQKFADATNADQNARRNIAPLSVLKGKTLTLTYNGEENSIRIYLDGQQHTKELLLTYTPGSTPRKAPKELTWGETLGGGSRLDLLCIDNLYFWPYALNAEEVHHIVRSKTSLLHWGIGVAGSIVLVLILLLLLKKKKNNGADSLTPDTPEQAPIPDTAQEQTPAITQPLTPEPKRTEQPTQEKPKMIFKKGGKIALPKKRRKPADELPPPGQEPSA